MRPLWKRLLHFTTSVHKLPALRSWHLRRLKGEYGLQKLHTGLLSERDWSGVLHRVRQGHILWVSTLLGLDTFNLNFLLPRSILLFSQQMCKMCSPCLPGYFGNETAQTKCTPCPMGTFQSTSGQETCQDCAAGFETR